MRPLLASPKLLLYVPPANASVMEPSAIPDGVGVVTYGCSSSSRPAGSAEIRTQHNGVGLAWMSPVLLKAAEILSLCWDWCSVSRMLQLFLTSLLSVYLQGLNVRV